MALVDCPACTKQISTGAYACPHCGHPAGRPFARSVRDMVDCPECATQISATAYACPNCGYPTRLVDWRRIGGILVLWVVLIIFFLILWQFLSPGRH